MPITRLAESGALSALVWIGILCGVILTQDDVGPTLSSSPVVQAETPKESYGQTASIALDLLHSVMAHKDLIKAHKSLEVPTELRPVDEPNLNLGTPAPEQQQVLKKMLELTEVPHTTQSPFQNPSLITESPTKAAEASSINISQSHLSIASTVENVAEPFDLPLAASSCKINFSDPEGYIDSLDDPPLPDGMFLQCTYTVNVYNGYGVELQVKSVNLSEGEQLSIRGLDEEGELLVLANQTLLVEGQVIRSPSNTISVFYRSSPLGGMGTFQLHYQLFPLSCALPRRPHFGEVSVLSLCPGGTGHFSCHMGYHLQGVAIITCLNASRPIWSQQEPSCRALCGSTVKNATVGRVLSPSPHLGANSTLDRSCSWSLEAPTGQRLHLNIERMALGPTDRLVLWSGLDAGSVVLFDSGRGTPIPFEGVISEGPAVRVQFITDQPNYHNTDFNIRYEAFEKGHCYEPHIQNGNLSTTDLTYAVGTIVQFSCDPGHSLEQGPPVIECINTRDPYWNDTEPLCKALCGGDLSGPSGLILSPNWPEWYGEGEDCSWRIHVGKEKRVLLDVQLLNISDSDVLTILDGDEVTTRILGQYVGGNSPFKLSSSTPDLTITFHSDPAGQVFGKGEGFIITFMEVSRNDSCSDLPEIQNGWKTTSHTALVRGTRITYQCDPGYDLVGRETLICLLDLSWNTQPPFCEKVMYCTDPGHVEHSVRTLSDPKLLVGTTIQYSCNPGYILQGGATLTCYGREPGTPVWTSRLPRCVLEETVSCENPGLPDNGYQILSKRLYLPGESLTFMCFQGYELIGEITIKCISGNPSFWSGPLPLCQANHECTSNHALEVVEATNLDGGRSMALAIFFIVLLLSFLLGGAYIYVTRCRYHSNLRLPLMYPHPYSQITVEAEFDNPIYETGGDTREYEVSI
ncbi:seizure 6-like protein [Trichomycterus rosablanca]|uniref:seizure 6-like protein n=1 Tax=Trichomycterus rosablanca TaxID=2290929 RepID=UPI002F353AB6